MAGAPANRQAVTAPRTWPCKGARARRSPGSSGSKPRARTRMRKATSTPSCCSTRPGAWWGLARGRGRREPPARHRAHLGRARRLPAQRLLPGHAL
eukprot:13728062-Alexandrium_andersonii.AAC.1